ncbi:MAG: ABC transporter permease subunit [Oscillospiraceae bacterium]
MTIYIKELKHSAKSWSIWTCAIAFMLLVCILMFPQMKNEMDSVSSVFANMGQFTAAFGMDKLSFGELMGFYGIECGNVLGIGGGFFAALVGISALANEEKEHTAEFLLTHPLSRISVITQKLLSIVTQVVAMNIFIVAVSLVSAEIIGEKFQMKELILLHVAYLIMQLEIACICFGISAFIRRGSMGIGLGLALALYFMNIICNISEQAEFLKYITPYAYAEASSIISESKLEMSLIGIGTVFAIAGIVIAYLKYSKKDIAA